MKFPFLISRSIVKNFGSVFSSSAGYYPERFLMILASVAGGLWSLSYSMFRKFEHDKLIYKVKPTSASIGTPTVRWLAAILQMVQPHSILELGTGYSSLIFASYAKRKGGVRITSLEHDYPWYKNQMQILRQLSLDSEIDLLLAPITLTQHGVDQLALYDKSVMDKFVDQSDLTFVDGPVGSKYGGPGRKGSLRQGITATRRGGLILLHDALREEEFGLVQSLMRDDSRVSLLGIFPDADGIAVFEKL